MSNKRLLLLALITVFVGGLLRLVALNKVPLDLSNDEISIAYDAYSVARTGRDEHNHFLPISFQSHNTYKAPLYAYILAPLTLFLTNTAQTARLPSAIAGILTILVVSKIAYILTKNKYITLFSLLFMALSPWHIYTSRMALEANLALLFLSASILGLLKTIENADWKWGTVGVVSGVMSMYGYHTEWALFPMIMLGVGLVIWSKNKRKVYLFMVILALVLAFPLIHDFISELGTHARANTEMIWDHPTIAEVLKNSTFSLVTKIEVLGNAIINNYFDYLSLSYLFFNGLSLFASNVFNPGLFLAPLLPMFIVGMFKINNYVEKKYVRFFWFWFMASPLIPALTLGGTNMVRNLVSVVPYTILVAVGTVFFWKSPIIKDWGRIVWVILMVIYFGSFGITYYYHLPIHDGVGVQEGYRQISVWIQNNYQKYHEIVVDPRFGEANQLQGVPHLYLAYFTHLDPKKILERRDTNYGLFFDKYTIHNIDWKNETISKNNLYVVPVSNLPPTSIKNMEVVKSFYLPDGKEQFRLYVVGTQKLPHIIEGV